MIFFQELWGYVSGLLSSGVSLSPKSFAFRKLNFKSVRAVSWMIRAIQAVTSATSVSLYLSHEESDISISYHHWNLRSVSKPSPTSFKSQDTLNIFRRTRGYPSVLRKVWPVYCSIQSWRFGCSWRKNSTRDTIQLPLVWLYQGKSFQDFPFKNFQSDFRLLRVWDKSLSDQDAGKYLLEQLLRVTYSTTQERKMIRLS